MTTYQSLKAKAANVPLSQNTPQLLLIVKEIYIHTYLTCPGHPQMLYCINPSCLPNVHCQLATALSTGPHSSHSLLPLHTTHTPISSPLTQSTQPTPPPPDIPSNSAPPPREGKIWVWAKNSRETAAQLGKLVVI